MRFSGINVKEIRKHASFMGRRNERGHYFKVEMKEENSKGD